MLTYSQIKKGMKFIGISGTGKNREDRRIFTVARKQKRGNKRIVWVDCAYLPIPNNDGSFGGLIDLDFTMGELNYGLKQISKDVKRLFLDAKPVPSDETIDPRD